jgi:hypothetical protein
MALVGPLKSPRELGFRLRGYNNLEINNDGRRNVAMGLYLFLTFGCCFIREM